MIKRYLRGLASDVRLILVTLVGLLLALVFIPLFALVKLLSWPFAKGEDLTAEEVAAYIRNELLDLRDDKYNWEEFEQISIRDPSLVSIRQKATKVAWPLTDEGRKTFEKLLRQLNN